MSLNTSTISTYAPLSPVQTMEPRLMYTGLGRLDRFIGGFERSTMTYLDSESRFLYDLTAQICVRSYATFGKDVVFVDGGNSMDPHAISQVCRKRHVDRHDALSSIKVARAFTAHQLSTLINDDLEKLLDETGASTLVVSRFLDLFLDKDMSWTESFQLIKRSMRSLRKYTMQHDLVTLVTNHGPRKTEYRKGLKELMHQEPDRFLKLERRNAALKILMDGKDEHMIFHPVNRAQTTLDEFYLVIIDGKDSTHI